MRIQLCQSVRFFVFLNIKPFQISDLLESAAQLDYCMHSLCHLNGKFNFMMCLSSYKRYFLGRRFCKVHFSTLYFHMGYWAI